MTNGTVQIELRLDCRPGIRAFRALGRRLSRLAQIVAESKENQRRHLAAGALALGRLESHFDQRVEAFCVTTNEGRCRVVVRQLGGWQ